MKIDRLIGILSILLQKETVTAPALAEQFKYREGQSAGILTPCARRASPSLQGRE